MSIKQCHCCVKRTGCKQKNKPSNLAKTPKTTWKLILSHTMPKRFIPKTEMPLDLKVTSYCKEFTLEGEVEQKKALSNHQTITSRWRHSISFSPFSPPRHQQQHLKQIGLNVTLRPCNLCQP